MSNTNRSSFISAGVVALSLTLSLGSAGAFAGLAQSESALFSFGKTVDAKDNLVDGNQDADKDSTTVKVAGFDASLGTLYGVNVSFETDYSMMVSAIASDYSLPTIGVSGEGSVDHTIELFGASASSSLGFGAKCGEQRTGPGKLACNYAESSGDSFNGSLDLATMPLDNFIGEDLKFLLTRDVFSDLTYCSASYCALLAEAIEWGGKINVNYSYVSAVPEPSVLVLLGLSIAGLGLARRKVQ